MASGSPGLDLPGAPESAEQVCGVRLVLEDGTLAKPSLDPELEERLRYIVDNIVPAPSKSDEGPPA